MRRSSCLRLIKSDTRLHQAKADSCATHPSDQQVIPSLRMSLQGDSDDFVRLHALSGLHSLAQLQLGFESRGSNSDGLRA